MEEFFKSKFENSFQSKNHCEIQKNILKSQIIFCHVIISPAVSQRHTPLPPPKWWSFVRKELTIESKMVQSDINVEENLGTTRYLAGGVEHYRRERERVLCDSTEERSN